MVRRVATLLLFIALSCTTPCLHAQVAHEKNGAEKAILLTALHRIHLDSPGASWHIKATVQLVQQGNPSETGTVDISRDIHGNLRTQFTFPDFHQATVTTAKGSFVTGDQGDAPAGLNDFFHFFEVPVRDSAIGKASIRTFDLKRNAVDFHCATAVMPPTPGITANRQSFCNIVGSPALRYFNIGPSYIALLEQVLSFQGGDVPAHATIFFQNVPIARITLAIAPRYSTTSIQPPATAALTAVDASEQVTSLLNKTLVVPYLTPSPVRIANPEDGAALYRIQLDGRDIKSIQTIAVSDARLARNIASAVRKTIAKSPAIAHGPLFVNYAYKLHTAASSAAIGADATADMPDVDTIQ